MKKFLSVFFSAMILTSANVLAQEMEAVEIIPADKVELVEIKDANNILIETEFVEGQEMSDTVIEIDNIEKLAEVNSVVEKEISSESESYVESGSMMVPVRGMAMAFSENSIVSWDESSKTVNVLMGSRVIQMTVGSRVMIVNGTEYNMTSTAVIKDGRIFVPLRDFCHALGISDNKIVWDEETQTVTIN